MIYDIEALMKDWNPPRSGDYAKDCQTGREIAECFLSAEHISPSDLGWTTNAIMRAGVFGGVEVGFYHTIAVKALEWRTGEDSDFPAISTSCGAKHAASAPNEVNGLRPEE